MSRSLSASEVARVFEDFAMPKIKFTQAYQVKGATPDDSPSYAEGDVVDVNDASAQHFISRGVAEMHGAKASKAATAPADAGTDYESLHVDELHKLASEREIEGRSALTTKADLIKALEKDDKSPARKK